MKLRKNAFFYFAVMVFLLCMLFSIACVFARLGAGQEYPYLLKGAWILGALALTLALLGAYVWKFSIPLVYFIFSMEECVRLLLTWIVFVRKNWMKKL